MTKKQKINNLDIKLSKIIHKKVKLFKKYEDSFPSILNNKEELISIFKELKLEHIYNNDIPYIQKNLWYYFLDFIITHSKNYYKHVFNLDSNNTEIHDRMKEVYKLLSIFHLTLWY
jgi:hypothetical protein